MGEWCVVLRGAYHCLASRQAGCDCAAPAMPCAWQCLHYALEVARTHQSSASCLYHWCQAILQLWQMQVLERAAAAANVHAPSFVNMRLNCLAAEHKMHVCAAYKPV